MTDKDLLPAEPASEGPNRLVRRNQSTEISTLLLNDEQARDPDEIDLLSYWRMLVKRRWLILSCVGATILLALLMTMLSTPLYRATTVIQIEKASQQILRDGELALPAYSSWDPDFLSTQLGLLQSNALAERVADDMKIDQATLARLRPPGFSQRLLALFRSDADEKSPQATQQAVSVADAARTRVAATNMVRGGLSVSPKPSTRLVNVAFVSTDPVFAARAANAVADGYIASEIDRRFGASSYAKTYLEEQLAIAKGRLEESERTLVEFAEQENLVNVGSGQSLAGQNLSNLNTSLATAQEQRIRAQSRLSQAGSSSTTLPQDVLATSLVPTLREQLADVQRAYQEKLRIFKPDYPEMQQIQGQIDELTKQVENEYSAVRASLRAEYDAAVSHEKMLREQLDMLRSETLDTSKRSIQYNTLQREADTNRQIYDSLLQRYNQVSAASDVRPNNISIVDRAQVPYGPFSPSLVRNIVIALLLGLMLGVALALLIEFLDDTLKTPEDIEQHLKLPVLGIIPKLTAKQTVARVSADPRSAFSEAYRSVRTALQFSTDHGTPRVLLITSPLPAEGKSTTAYTLARNFSQMGKSVLLIEADLRSPSLHRMVPKPHVEKGLSNLLAGSSTLQDATISGGAGEPDVLLAGPLPPNPAELLAGVRLRVLLDVALNRYDQIIIDGPPVMGIADSPLLANAGDSTLLVVQSGGTRIRDAQGAIKRLRGARTRLLGVVLTKYDARQAGYGYQYQGYYAYGGTPRLSGK